MSCHTTHYKSTRLGRRESKRKRLQKREMPFIFLQSTFSVIFFQVDDTHSYVFLWFCWMKNSIQVFQLLSQITMGSDHLIQVSCKLSSKPRSCWRYKLDFCVNVIKWASISTFQPWKIWRGFHEFKIQIIWLYTRTTWIYLTYI